MQDLAHWLEKLGMSEYAQRFAENGISVAALRHLTDQDLKDMGVLLGHRRIILAAIQGLAGDSSAATKAATAGDAKEMPSVHGGHLHNDYCFAEDGDADTFVRRFGGETFDPEQRGKGR